MAQQATDDTPAASDYDYAHPAHVELDDVTDFVDAALSQFRAKLKSNRGAAKAMTDVTMSVDEVLSPENVREIEVRAEPFENPKVTLWLRDCPIWANDSWTDYIYPDGLNAYNGKVHTTFDSREF